MVRSRCRLHWLNEEPAGRGECLCVCLRVSVCVCACVAVTKSLPHCVCASMWQGIPVNSNDEAAVGALSVVCQLQVKGMQSSHTHMRAHTLLPASNTALYCSAT